MLTRYTIIKPGAEQEIHEIEMAEQPDYDDLEDLLAPILGGYPERVAVVNDGEMTDMFVLDYSAIDPMPWNEVATRIYRAATLNQHPETPADSLHAIYGTAVLFHRPVWF